MNQVAAKHFESRFPDFARMLLRGSLNPLGGISPPATEQELDAIESDTGIKLPDSYKDFLRCAREIWLFGDSLRFERGHPFVHRFPPLESLSRRQLDVVEIRAKGEWPPPSEGMLCIAECFWLADGDQILFDVFRAGHDGEYPIMYYAHEESPPRVIELCSDFERWLGSLPSYKRKIET